MRSLFANLYAPLPSASKTLPLASLFQKYSLQAHPAGSRDMTNSRATAKPERFAPAKCDLTEGDRS